MPKPTDPPAIDSVWETRQSSCPIRLRVVVVGRTSCMLRREDDGRTIYTATFAQLHNAYRQVSHE